MHILGQSLAEEKNQMIRKVDLPCWLLSRESIWFQLSGESED